MEINRKYANVMVELLIFYYKNEIGVADEDCKIELVDNDYISIEWEKGDSAGYGDIYLTDNNNGDIETIECYNNNLDYYEGVTGNIGKYERIPVDTDC